MWGKYREHCYPPTRSDQPYTHRYQQSSQCHISGCAPPPLFPTAPYSPILEMVTEKYLLREEEESDARRRSMEITHELLISFRRSDVKSIARLVTENFLGPIRAVIPFASTLRGCRSASGRISGASSCAGACPVAGWAFSSIQA